MKPRSLYVILDKQYCHNRPLAEIVSLLVQGGADLIQYRNKTGSEEEKLKEAREIASLLKKTPIQFIINDDPFLAQKVGADGVHLGQSDGSIAQARALLGTQKTIGVTTRSVPEALRAEKEGATYIAVGDLFGTHTKPNTQKTSLKTLKQICNSVSIPVIAIGGITSENKSQALTAGAHSIAVSRAILTAPNISAQCQRFKPLAENSL